MLPSHISPSHQTPRPHQWSRTSKLPDRVKNSLMLGLCYRPEYHERGFRLDDQCNWAYFETDGYPQRPEFQLLEDG